MDLSSITLPIYIYIYIYVCVCVCVCVCVYIYIKYQYYDNHKNTSEHQFSNNMQKMFLTSVLQQCEESFHTFKDQLYNDAKNISTPLNICFVKIGRLHYTFKCQFCNIAKSRSIHSNISIAIKRRTYIYF